MPANAANVPTHKAMRHPSGKEVRNDEASPTHRTIRSSGNATKRPKNDVSQSQCGLLTALAVSMIIGTETTQQTNINHGASRRSAEKEFAMRAEEVDVP